MVPFKYDHIIGTSSIPKSPDRLLEHVEEVVSAHSDTVTKLAEEAKATVARYVLSYLAIAPYAKLEAQS